MSHKYKRVKKQSKKTKPRSATNCDRKIGYGMSEHKRYSLLNYQVIKRRVHNLSKWDHEGLSQDYLMKGFGPVFIRSWPSGSPFDVTSRGLQFMRGGLRI